MAKAPIDNVGRKSLRGFQVAPPSVVFQMPPDAAAEYTVFGSPGSIAMPRMRPPTLPGPRGCQAPNVAASLEMPVAPERVPKRMAGKRWESDLAFR